MMRCTHGTSLHALRQAKLWRVTPSCGAACLRPAHSEIGHWSLVMVIDGHWSLVMVMRLVICLRPAHSKIGHSYLHEGFKWGNAHSEIGHLYLHEGFEWGNAHSEIAHLYLHEGFEWGNAHSEWGNACSKKMLTVRKCSQWVRNVHSKECSRWGNARTMCAQRHMSSVISDDVSAFDNFHVIL